jgi:hypothetical protein
MQSAPSKPPVIAVDIVARRRQVPFTGGVKSIGARSIIFALGLSKEPGPRQVSATRSD